MSSSSCSSGDSDIADFVNAFGSDSEDGELPTPPTSAAAPVGAATATTVAEPEPEPEPAVDKLHSSSSAADPSVRGWEALCVSFRRSDPPAQVAEAFTSVAVRPKPGTFPFPRISS